MDSRVERSMLWLLFVGLACSLARPASAVEIDWTIVGDPGNACDAQPQGCFGSVAYEYRIGTHEVTNSEYAEFLNAVAATDTNALYGPWIPDFGGILQTGSFGSYVYVTLPGWEDVPVINVTFHSALRFANWLHNGQPTGAQDESTTEDGAYTITDPGVEGNSIVRNPGARFALASEDEWYKAAYYDASSTSYSDYPTGTNAQTTCASPTSTPNHANCNQPELAVVGSYPGSASPYGTFDQGGNLFEWNEAVVNGARRGVRGGDILHDASRLVASDRAGADPSINWFNIGFRVVPEPISALPAGLMWLILGSRRNRRPRRSWSGDGRGRIEKHDA